MKKLNFVFGLFVLLLAGCTSAPAYHESGTAYAADALQKFVDSGEMPGAICVYYHDGIQETACIGWADVEKQIPINMDQLFMQCSQTKSFCGVTIAMLVEEGLIDLDDPVSKYLPCFSDLKVAVKDADGKETVVPAKNTLTIRMVMNHTGGFAFEIPTKNAKGWPALSLQDTAKEAASIPLRFEPGTDALYSNTGIDIGAAVVEVVTGMPWEDFLQERVFDPLDMKDATFNPTDEQLSRSISMYDVRPGKKAVYREYHPAMPLPHNGPEVYPSAGAGLWLTANDQLKYAKMLMNLGVGENGVRILEEDTVRELLATSTRPEGMGGYSLGLSADGKNFGHGGAWGSVFSVNWEERDIVLWVVQVCGDQSGWIKARDDGFREFLSGRETADAAAEYTGRME